MKAYQKGDISSFEELYSRYKDRLMRFFGFRLSAVHFNFADDLFQITWMKVHRSRKDFDTKKKFSSWVFQIAINSLRDYVTLSRFKEEISTENIESHSSKASDPAWQIDFDRARAHLEKLPCTEKEIILLSDLEGFTSKEISQLLDLKEDSIRQILSRTRKKLRETLGGLSA